MVHPLIIQKKDSILAEVYSFLEDPTVPKKEFISKIINRIPFIEGIGFAGYKSIIALEKFLLWSIYDDSERLWKPIVFNDCIKQIRTVLEKCYTFIGGITIRIFLFPTIDTFTISKMDGVSGFTPWKNTILLNIFHTKGWKRTLRNTICHELAHAIALNFNSRRTVQDNLIFEGVAEHFREEILNHNTAPWVKSISKEKAREIVDKIKHQFKKEDDNLCRLLFFGGGEFPIWSGYAIGYYIVEAYLNKLDTNDLNELFRMPPSEIIDDNAFLG